MKEAAKKYLKEYCLNCRNKEMGLCEIHFYVLDGTVQAQCCYYEKEEKDDSN